MSEVGKDGGMDDFVSNASDAVVAESTPSDKSCSNVEINNNAETNNIVEPIRCLAVCLNRLSDEELKKYNLRNPGPPPKKRVRLDRRNSSEDATCKVRDTDTGTFHRNSTAGLLMGDGELDYDAFTDGSPAETETRPFDETPCIETGQPGDVVVKNIERKEKKQDKERRDKDRKKDGRKKDSVKDRKCREEGEKRRDAKSAKCKEKKEEISEKSRKEEKKEPSKNKEDTTKQESQQKKLNSFRIPRLAANVDNPAPTIGLPLLLQFGYENTCVDESLLKKKKSMPEPAKNNKDLAVGNKSRSEEHHPSKNECTRTVTFAAEPSIRNISPRPDRSYNQCITNIRQDLCYVPQSGLPQSSVSLMSEEMGRQPRYCISSLILISIGCRPSVNSGFNFNFKPTEKCINFFLIYFKI